VQAQQRYEDVVGGLSARREGLQQQIEALERFDRDYRGRITSFMQTQLRALWADQPQVAVDDAEVATQDQVTQDPATQDQATPDQAPLPAAEVEPARQ
jgi:2-hydroxychromene-2-carboxylate isomerase